MDGFFIDAQVLAEFSNLNSKDNDPLSPTNKDHFRHNHPGFVPDNWWTVYDSPDDSEPRSRYVRWEIAQEYLRTCWKEYFPVQTCVSLITFGSREVVTPYQQAVMYLVVNRWRAKFCLRCGNRFVASAPKSIYCSDACFQSARKDSKKAWWNEHGPQWRTKRTKSAKSKGSK
jgi:hypothetical protein